jgi:hypothetical protein
VIGASGGARHMSACHLVTRTAPAAHHRSIRIAPAGTTTEELPACSNERSEPLDPAWLPHAP